MKVTKYTLNISAEALSVDSFRGLLVDMLEQIDREAPGGFLRKDDGDSIQWDIDVGKQQDI